MDKENKNMPVICFGETLWDVFENQKKPGGAPMNVAVHLRQFGVRSKVISRVGTDELGIELTEFLKSKKVDSDLIQQDAEHPTGLVNVTVGPSGDANYDIVFPSAWDFIDIPENKSAWADEKFVLVFGSLASRNGHSRNTLLYLLEKAETTIFDVNFRAPHYTRTLTEQLLSSAEVVKLNEHEIAIIGEWMGIQNGTEEELAEKIADAYKVDQIIVTLGDKGALVYLDKQVHRHPGFNVTVADTVGSGDSFLAAYLSHFLKGNPVEECLTLACATGAFVATQNGAVPEYGMCDIKSVMDN